MTSAVACVFAGNFGDVLPSAGDAHALDGEVPQRGVVVDQRDGEPVAVRVAHHGRDELIARFAGPENDDSGGEIRIGSQLTLAVRRQM